MSKSKSKSKAKAKPMDPRVRIARDVIARLDQKTFTASPGTFLYKKLTKAEQKDLDADARKVLKTKTCEGCARGALFLARLDRQNSLKLADLVQIECLWDPKAQEYRDVPNVDIDREKTSEYLEEFSEAQLELIESAFEIVAFGEVAAYDDLRAAQAFGEQYKTPAKRLRAICENIIKNKGEFRPQDGV